MNLIWVIASNDLRVFLKDKGGYVWLFLMPLIFIYLFGSAMNGPTGEPRSPKPRVVVENLDEGYLGQLFIEQLTKEGFEVEKPAVEETGGEASSSGDPSVEDLSEKKSTEDASMHLDPRARAIRIPADFTSNVEAAQQVDVEFIRGEDSGIESAAMVEMRINRAIVSLTSAIFATVSSTPDSVVSEDGLRKMLDRESAVNLDVHFAGRRKVPVGFQQSVPGYLVMFVLMNLLIFGGLAISQERTNGVLRRVATHPVTRTQLIAGKILGRFLLGVVQIVFLLVVSGLFFGIDYGGKLFPITVTMLLFAWGCASLGVFIGAVIRTPESVQGICTLGSIAMAALGGCWWPLEIVPDTARSFGQLFPTAWAMNAMHQLFTFGGGFTDIQTELLLIIGFAITSTVLAAKYLRV